MRRMNNILKCVIVAVTIVCFSNVASADLRYTTAPSGLRLRNNYSTDAEILDVIPYNTEVEAVGYVVKGFEKWYKVEYEDKVGYVSSKWIKKPDEETETAAEDSHGDMEYLGNWLMTAYTHTGSVCANGNYPTAGYTIACNSLDFGTEIYIDGIGYRTVEDRGPGSLGSDWIDIFCDSYDECVAFGTQYRDIWVVK